MINYTPNGKVMIAYLITGLKKGPCIKVSQCFPKPYEPFGGDINVNVDLSNYAKKKQISKIFHMLILQVLQ